jgi:gliding motility-associated-like protein
VVEIITTPWDTTICEGDSIYLEDDYQTQAGTYFDYYKAASGCDSVVATELFIESLPWVSLGNDTILQEGETMTLDAFYPDADYLWQDGSINSTYIVEEQGNYKVIVSTHCGAVEDSIFVFYGNFFCDPYSPNAFTPNNDGTNDYFSPKLPCEILDYKLMIYNRWGELVYTTDDRERGWDGKIRGGERAEQGTYVWVLNYRVGLYNNVEDKVARGVVLLIE